MQFGVIKRILKRIRPVVLSDELVALLNSARERARSYSHDYVGVEHVFLSAWALPESHPAHRLIGALPVDVAAFISDLENSSRVVTGRPVPAFIPQTPRLQRVLDLAKTWARRGNHTEVRVVHFLGAVAWERNSAVSHVLRKHLEKALDFGPAQAAAAYFATLTSYPEARVFDIEEVPNPPPSTIAAVTPPAGQEAHQP